MVSVIESSAAAAARVRLAPSDQQLGIQFVTFFLRLRCVTSGSNLDLVLLQIELKINEIEAFCITIHN